MTVELDPIVKKAPLLAERRLVIIKFPGKIILLR